MTIATLLLSVNDHVRENKGQSLLVTVLVAPLIYILVNELTRYNARISGLRGPPGWPLIGNLWDIRENASEKYRQWARTYGGVYQIQLGNIPIVVVNSANAAKTIFGGNSQAMSSRPEFYTFHKVLSDTAGTTIGTSPYSDSLKRRRKGAASALNRPSVATYVDHLDLETRDFIKELVEYGDGGSKPIDPFRMIQRLALSLGLTLNWGIRLKSQQDDLFSEITYVEEEISRFRSTTSNLQDYIPILRLNPFTSQSPKAREMRNRRDKYLAFLNDGLDERIANGTYKPCIQANVIMDKEAKLNKAELTSISLTMLAGGLDTVSTQVSWFLAFLSQHPEVQEKAVSEIRKTFPADQPMCDARDDQKCEYVAALVKESLRYFTVLRLALPRATTRDIVYEGVSIPKGSIIFLNSWACNMDKEIWEDPEVFRPERWFEQPDAPMLSYGLGYRMCTGYLLANRELYLLYMRLFNSLKVEKYEDVDCDPLTGIADPTTLTTLPRPYKAYFVPRDPDALNLALSEE